MDAYRASNILSRCDVPRGIEEAEQHLIDMYGDDIEMDDETESE